MLQERGFHSLKCSWNIDKETGHRKLFQRCTALHQLHGNTGSEQSPGSLQPISWPSQAQSSHLGSDDHPKAKAVTWLPL